MKIRIVMLASIAFSLFGLSCNSECSGKKIYFGLIYARQDDTLKVFFDEKLVANKVVREDYIGHFQDKNDKLTIACANKDSILTKIVVNRRDTTFFIYPKDINECYVGADKAGVIRVYYNYVDGGFRKYDPKR
jgi:hypothetical protein